jgi:beta-lactam-binding protein with PASTA domain
LSIGKHLLAIGSRLTVVITVAIAFLLGVTGTIYLSLKSPEVKVPEIVGKDMVSAEDTLNHAGLNIRKRTSRFSPGTQPNVVLDQIPKAGEVVKEGQTVAVVISRAAMEGESQTPVPGTSDSTNKNQDAANENKGNEDSSGSESKSDRNKNKNKNSNSAKNANSNNANSNNQNSANKNNNNSNRPLNRNSAVNSNLRNSNSSANRNVPTLNVNRRTPGTSPTPATRTNSNHIP